MPSQEVQWALNIKLRTKNSRVSLKKHTDLTIKRWDTALRSVLLSFLGGSFGRSHTFHPLCGGGLISHRYLYIFFLWCIRGTMHCMAHLTVPNAFPTNQAILTIIKTPLWTHPRLCGTSLFASPFAALKDHKQQLHWQRWCVEWGGTLAAKMEAAAAGFRGTWGYLSHTLDPRQDNRLSTGLLQHIKY